MAVNYVLGFAITPDKKSVLLVEKKFGPPVNVGKWNGIGGKMNSWEPPGRAMAREFREEVGVDGVTWDYFGALRGDEWSVLLFKGELDDETPIGIKVDEHRRAKCNDVGEFLDWHLVRDVFAPEHGTLYAWNVPVMIAHAIKGDGLLYLYDVEEPGARGLCP